MAKKLSFIDAAAVVLEAAGGPLHYSEITSRALDQELVETTGKTPHKTLNSVICTDMISKGDQSRFRRVAKGTFALRSILPEVGQGPEGSLGEEGGDRIRVPYFPRYSGLRPLLSALDGVQRKAITGLHSNLMKITGTPQERVSWLAPDTWIDERLAGEDRELAWKIWRATSGQVNPRHMYGHWRVCELFGLLEESNGEMQLSDQGRSFIKEPLGEVAQRIDDHEGVTRLLTLVAENSPAFKRDLAPPWHDYVVRVSRHKTESSIASLLSYRLRNLVDRKLIKRAGGRYEPTELGNSYLEQTGGEGADSSTSDAPELGRLIKDQQQSVKDSLREAIETLDPYDFEGLIGRLLDEMGYDNVEVTSPSNDKGIDVLGDIEVGITSVREVIQVKRHKAKIQRKDLDALRGSLHRFDAVRATIITSGDFSRGTLEAAFEKGAAPITLINGDRLIDLLIEHGIGVRKRKVELWEFDATSLTEGDEEPEVEPE